MAKAITSAFQGRLTLGDVLRMLVNDGIVEKALAEKLYRDRRLDRSNIHPLVVIGEQQWKDRTDNNKPLTVESLTAWLAKRAGLECIHVDPLKLDVGSIAQVVSKAYAERLKIMPVKVQDN